MTEKERAAAIVLKRFNELKPEETCQMYDDPFDPLTDNIDPKVLREYADKIIKELPEDAVYFETSIPSS